MNFSKVAKDASKPAVSWLNFEPKVSKFPFDNSQELAIINHATGKIHGSFCMMGMGCVRIVFVVADDASSLALRVSWLKFEPKVSNFRATKANTWLWLLELQRIVSWLFLCCWNRGRKIVSVVVDNASSFAMRISWLNFESWSQSFLLIIANSWLLSIMLREKFISLFIRGFCMRFS